ncbi:hypothetical protein GCM10010420_36460 [Streptomyces glaucosporus]|uniref:N-acetyltransferase domain-containing protein n=1 Tax=Streptomyces glaucosporus TaxID=284044 RepID=A0ABN3IHW4_9ACTN
MRTLQQGAETLDTADAADFTLSDALLPGEERLFEELLLAELPHFYDEVDPSFPRSLMYTARLGSDDYGYFTLRKRIFVARRDRVPIGFTVATYKRGGSVKMGPTVTVAELRRTGIGTRFRGAVEAEIARDPRIRKLYLTISGSNDRTLLFNLGLGYQVEGVLRGQYRAGQDEVVLGRIVRPAGEAAVGRNQIPAGSGRAPEVRQGTVDPDRLAEFMLRRMRSGFAGVDHSFVESIVRALAADRQVYARKGKSLLTAYHDGAVRGVGVLVPKRGGAIKLSPLLVDDLGVARAIVRAACRLADDQGRRRIYVVLPIADNSVVELLLREGFALEAQLREAYRPGMDTLVLGKCLC